MRSPLLLLAVAAVAMCVPACGGRAEPGSGPPATGTGTAKATSASSCFVLAANYDQTCTQDSDCVAVPPGGDTCDPCSAGTGCLFCRLATVNVGASAKYLADLAAALQPYQGQNMDDYVGCVFGSCPVESAGLATCQGGLCSAGLGPPVCTPDDTHGGALLD